MWENGSVKPSVDVCIQLAKALNVSLDEFLTCGQKIVPVKTEEEEILEAYEEAFGPRNAYIKSLRDLVEMTWKQLGIQACVEVAYEAKFDYICKGGIGFSDDVDYAQTEVLREQEGKNTGYTFQPRF